MTEDMKGRRIGWSLYSILLGLLLVVMYVVVMTAHWRQIYLLDLPLTLVAYCGLIGYSFRVRVLRKQFWLVYAPAFIGWELLFNFVLSYDRNTEGALAQTAVWMVVLLGPEYYALCRYAYASDELWPRPSP